MTKFRLLALFFIAASAFSVRAAGSNVYKCGSTYSQIPCPGAVAVQVGDERSRDQKSRSDAAIVQQRKMANAMERARLKEEAQAIAQSKPAHSAEKPTAKTQTKPKADNNTLETVKGRKVKKKESEFFTAKETNPPAKK